MKGLLCKCMLLSMWLAVHMAYGATASVVSFTASEPDENGSVQLNWVVTGPSYAGGIRFNVAVSRSETNDLMASTIITGAYMDQRNSVRGSLVDTPPVAGKTYYYWLNCAPYNSSFYNNFAYLWLNGEYNRIHNSSPYGPVTVYIPAPLTLSVKSADWLEGSITFMCEGAGGGSAEHDYALSYYDEESSTWVDVEEAENTKGDNDGETCFVDKDYLLRLGGVSPVKYRVHDQNGRVSNECVTRNRHGILVGLSQWAYNSHLKTLPGVEDVDAAYERFSGDGGFLDIKKCVNGTATIQGVEAAFRAVAETIEKGDICLYYFSTHGGINQNGDAVLCLYNGDYTDKDLAKHIKSLDNGSGDVAKIGIISACHSGALYDNPYQTSSSASWYMAQGLAQCSVNMAWITAADAAASSFGLFDTFMFKYGWEDGWAGSGSSLSLLQLASYTKRQYDSLFSEIIFQGEQNSKEVQIENGPLLSKIIVEKSSTPNGGVPSVPSGFNASQGEFKNKIRLSWNPAANTDVYWIFHKYGSQSDFTGRLYGTRQNSYDIEIHNTGDDSDEYGDFMDTDPEFPLICVVKAVNGAGVTATQPFEAFGWVDSSWEIRFNPSYGIITGAWMGEELQQSTSGDVLVKKMSKGDILQVVDSGPNVEREGFTLVGWYDENGVRLLPGMLIYQETTFSARWTGMTQEWLNRHQTVSTAANGDIATAAAMPAANGRCTVGECYSLGVNPEDLNDDLRIVGFKKEDGKPVITLNHTTDGSGNSFLPCVKTFGKKTLLDVNWTDITDKDQSEYRFFKVRVDLR